MLYTNRMATRKQVGNTGEHIVAQYLRSKGYTVLGTNYLKKWGEIDIIAEKGGTMHFVEVKTISRENISFANRTRFETYAPEENMHPQKIVRLQKAIQSYILERSYEGEWQLDLVTVELFVKDKKALCNIIPNVL